MSLPQTHWAALEQICRRLEAEQITWALTGSAGLALQGVPVEVHDLDLQADEVNVYRIERLFQAQVTRPVAFSATEQIGSHFGALEIDGIKVELMGGLQKRLPNGEWEPPISVTALRCFVEVNNLRVPVLPLRHEYEAYLMLGRPAKAELIRRTMEQ
jgi:hypothetical protein